MSPARNGRRRLGTPQGLTTAAAILLACSLTACGPANTGLQQDAARQLQDRVLSVSQAAAGNDPAGGLAALDGLEADLAAAVGNGQVTEDRRRSIMTAAAAVRADLTEVKALADAAAAKAAEDAAAQKQAEADAAAAEEQTAAPVPAAPTPGDGKGNKGKGKDDD